jgi:hypothetical protein
VEEYGVDGVVLLHITDEDLRDDINVESSILRKKVLNEVHKLVEQHGTDASGALVDKPDQDFWQVRAR